MPKLIYLARHNNQILDDTEGHITHGFKNHGWEVVEIQEENYLSSPTEADLYLWNHWDNRDGLKWLKENCKGIKAFWYFDKVWQRALERDELTTREKLIRDYLEIVDYGFIGDGTYVNNHPNPKFRILRQGMGERLMDQGLGTVRGLGQGKIAFAGSLYGERELWAKKLKDVYGNDFQIVSGFYNRDLYDFCAETPIIVAPMYSIDNYYWGNRVYMITGSGGFLIHPRCKDLEKEFKDSEEIVFYDWTMDDLYEKIDYYLARPEEREKIRLAGFEKTKKDYNFTKRVGELLSYLK